MLMTFTASTWIVAMIPRVQMVNAWRAGPIPTASPCSTTPKMLPVSTLVAGRRATTQDLRLLMTAFEAKKKALLVNLTTASDTAYMVPWPHMPAAETSNGQVHGTYDYGACPEQKFHPYHR